MSRRLSGRVDARGRSSRRDAHDSARGRPAVLATVPRARRSHPPSRGGARQLPPRGARPAVGADLDDRTAVGRRGASKAGVSSPARWMATQASSAPLVSRPAASRSARTARGATSRAGPSASSAARKAARVEGREKCSGAPENSAASGPATSPPMSPGETQREQRRRATDLRLGDEAEAGGRASRPARGSAARRIGRARR